MSDIYTWAEKEVEIALQKEFNGNEEDPGYLWAKACYESALKAYKCLLDDDHSNNSIAATKKILNRLIETKCLSPIEDGEDIWNKVTDKDDKDEYQCRRMSSLFKSVNRETGIISYSDLDRVIGLDEDTKHTFYSGRLCRIVDNLYPIQLPYYPMDRPFIVHVRQFIVDPKNGDWDTEAILYIDTPHGIRQDINEFYHEQDGKMVLITKEEFDELYERRIVKEEKEENL